MKKIYYNGEFITLENNNIENIEAILIEDDIIKKVGSKEEIMHFKDFSTEVIDLKGKTIMPAFIDSHSHFIAVANKYLQVSLEECSSIEEVQEKLLKYKLENNIENNKWIIADGYDNNNFFDKKHITKKQIDDILPNNPVVIKNKSGHSGVINTKGLKILNIDVNTPNPAGGIIGKENNELTGYLEENAFIENIKKVPMPNLKDIIKAVKKAEKEYFSYGITTAQEGFMAKELTSIYKEIIRENNLKIDIIVYIEKDIIKNMKNEFSKNFKKYYNHIKIQGIKIFLDGSPQAKTAWMRTPYESEKEYCGYGTMNDKDVENALEQAYNEKIQILAHCNGDMAAKQYLESIDKVNKKIHDNIGKIRPVLIHGQLLGIDQLPLIKKLEVIPSFFIAHVYYFGDIHTKNLGIERASKISPAKSSLDNEILFTFHQDSPVINPNMFETIWCSVSRITKNGKILGKDEKINVIDAIKAVTINGAYQYFEEDIKGSIKEGKKADLIIIDKNPLKIDMSEIRNIKVLETIKNGETVYKNKKVDINVKR